MSSLNNKPSDKPKKRQIALELVKKYLSQSESIDGEELTVSDELQPFEKGKLDRQRERKRFEELEKDRFQQENQR